MSFYLRWGKGVCKKKIATINDDGYIFNIEPGREVAIVDLEDFYALFVVAGAMGKHGRSERIDALWEYGKNGEKIPIAEIIKKFNLTQEYLDKLENDDKI